MNRRSLRWKCVLLSVGLCALGAVAAAQGAAVVAPAEKTGWWIRINPTNQAERVYWRFGAEPTALGAPVTWVQGQSPEAVDAPGDRLLQRVHVAMLGMPPAAPVSLCLFFRDRGVALVEYVRETTLVVEQGQNAPECVP